MFLLRNKKNIDSFWLKKGLIKSYGLSPTIICNPCNFTAKERLKFKGNEELLWSLKQVEETSASTGLTPDHIVSLVDVASSGIQGIHTVHVFFFFSKSYHIKPTTLSVCLEFSKLLIAQDKVPFFFFFFSTKK